MVLSNVSDTMMPERTAKSTLYCREATLMMPLFAWTHATARPNPHRTTNQKVEELLDAAKMVFTSKILFVTENLKNTVVGQASGQFHPGGRPFAPGPGVTLTRAALSEATVFPRRVYAWMGRNLVDAQIHTNPPVTGIAVIVFWKDVKLEEGTLDWRSIDRLREATAEADQEVVLHVPAWDAPAWLYDKGAYPLDCISEKRVDCFPDHPPCIQRMPVAWNRIYIERFENLIGALGAHLAVRPDLETALISLHGAAINIAKGWGLPQTDPDGVTMIDLFYGYTDDVALPPLKDVVDGVMTTIPDKSLMDAVPEDSHSYQAADQGLSAADLAVIPGGGDAGR